MKKKLYITAVLLVMLLTFAVRISEKMGEDDKQSDTDGFNASGREVQAEWVRPDMREEADDFEADVISMSSTEQKKIRKSVLDSAEVCRGIYEQADKGEAENVILSDQDMKKLAGCLAGEGYTVSCGGNLYNMQNEERLDQVLKSASNKEPAEAEFFHITKSGVFEWRKLEFSEGEMTMTYAGAGWSGKEEALKPQVSYLEKVRVYDWKYTEKGWLIIEVSKSKNHEMDMHSMFRVLPLSEECRDYCRRYIEPVSYMGNNLFLTDWDEESMDKVVFNDVFEFLYTMETGEKYEQKEHPNGVPGKLYESVIISRFPITAEKLEQLPGYSEETQTYSFTAMGCGTVIPQPHPFPEVVEVTEQENGSVILTVDAGLLQAGTDRAFTHEVRMKPDSEGQMKYLGNHILESEENKMPGYMPRTSYQ